VDQPTQIDGQLSHQIGGATAFAMINNLLYLEAGAYDSFSSDAQNGFGIAPANQLKLAGPAPYWRAVVQKNWQAHYFALGHNGMMAEVSNVNRDFSMGSNKYTDLAVDFTHQYMGIDHIFETKMNYIYEDQSLMGLQQIASSGSGLPPTSGHTYLETFKFNTAYTYEQTYGITLGYNKTISSVDANLYNQINPTGNFNGSGNLISPTRANCEYYSVELVYVPFGKSRDFNYLMNLRTTLQYIGYSQAYGTYAGAQNYNTFMLNGQLAF
jgi:hypothetical protein